MCQSLSPVMPAGITVPAIIADPAVFLIPSVTAIVPLIPVAPVPIAAIIISLVPGGAVIHSSSCPIWSIVVRTVVVCAKVSAGIVCSRPVVVMRYCTENNLRVDSPYLVISEKDIKDENLLLRTGKKKNDAAITAAVAGSMASARLFSAKIRPPANTSTRLIEISFFISLPPFGLSFNQSLSNQYEERAEGL